MWKQDPFVDEAGFTTVGMVLALLITLALVFTSAQVYRVSSASADIQDVADAAALAAQNEVAEFMIVARVCDAVVLSLSLTGIVSTGLGVIALCVPATAGMSTKLLEAGRDVMQARDSFAKKAASGLNTLQKALPFIAAANAASVAAANNGGPMNAFYLGFAVLVPMEGEDIGVDDVAGYDQLADTVDDNAEAIKQAAEEAEEAAQEAKSWKQIAFERDCGDAPGYCMYERAQALAGMEGVDNPHFSSIDTWSFSVALKRAQNYYACRLSLEESEGSSTAEKARSALRQQFYRYASDQVRQGYVHESSGVFDAYFPRLPKNTEEMRGTELYTADAYPFSVDDAGASTMHAWPGCPGAKTATGQGSIALMEQGDFATCVLCEFSASSMGRVASASTSIDNGFEYHYEAVAEAAEAYQKARETSDPLIASVKEKAGKLFDSFLSVLESVGGMRIEAAPPGRYGVVAFAVNITAVPASTGFGNGFVHTSASLGTRAAVSAATLVAEKSDEGKNVLSSLMDGWAEGGGAVSGVLGVVFDCWSGLLNAYSDGQEAVAETVEQALGALPLVGETGLGSWAGDTFKKVVDTLGLQPAKLEALKPVTVNATHVAAADDTSFSARFLSVKKLAIENPLSSTDLFSSVVTAAEKAAIEGIVGLGDTIEIASIEFLGEGGPVIPIVIALPPAVKNFATDVLGDIAEGVRGAYAQITGVRSWE